ncbi:hypothetical protein AAFC00_000902 [Neodothiora populina]|uniref:Pentatricopeptide repeat protein n=1 Tax=Neodothiora populina TaxID=2781224 RepID=A0ABR3PMD5_9PEZI
MPPRHRLYGRLDSLISRVAAQQPCHHDPPLLFLYPRWFTGSTTTSTTQHQPTATESSTRDSDVQTIDHPVDEATPLQGSSKSPRRTAGNSRGRTASDPDSRPSTKLVKRLVVRKNLARHKEEKRNVIINAKYPKFEDWRDAFTELQKRTPRGEQQHISQLQRLNMPDGTTGYYSGSLGTLFLEVYLMTDCQVQITIDDMADADWERHGESRHFKSLYLVGTPAAIKAAKQYLNNNIKIRTMKDGDSDGRNMGRYRLTSIPQSQDSPLRSVFANGYSRRQTQKLVHEIALPQAWTTITVANYVSDLVKSKPPRVRRVSSYSPVDTTTMSKHIDVITKCLVRLLTDPSIHPYISSRATNDALDFLTGHRKLPEVRQIMEALDTSRVRRSHPNGRILTIRNFNTCLRSAAFAGDVHNFTFLLKAMRSRSNIPDWETWTAFLNLVHLRDPKAARLAVLPVMREMGMLANTQARMAVGDALVGSTFADWVDRGGSTSAFFEHYDKMMQGKDWLDKSGANAMLAVRCKRGQFTDALYILSVLRERGRHPNEVTLNTLAEEAAAQNNTTALLASMDAINGPTAPAKAGGVAIEERLYTRLFLMAGRTRAYNLMRVVWRYACMSGNVSNSMQKGFEEAALWYAPRSRTTSKAKGILRSKSVQQGQNDVESSLHDSRLNRSKAFMTKAALGVADDVQHISTSAPETSLDALESDSADSEEIGATKDRLVDLAKQPGTTPEPDVTSETQAHNEWAQNERESFLLGLIQKDMAAYGEYQPVNSFLESLESAIEKDKEWTAAGVDFWRDPDFAWILQNAVKVPVVATRNSSHKEEEKSTVETHSDSQVESRDKAVFDVDST